MGKASQRKHRVKCDFCSTPDPRWAYRTEGDATEVLSGSSPGVGGWAACDTCKDLIERGRHDDLARRSMKTVFQIHPRMSQLPTQALLPMFRRLHDAFRHYRVGSVMSAQEYNRRYQAPLGVRMDEFLRQEGVSLVMGRVGRPGDAIGRPVPNGQAIFRHSQDDPSSYEREGFTMEQLSDPKTVDFLMSRIEHDRPTPNIPLTIPAIQVIKEWVGARTYLQAVSGVYGECPRPDDKFVPRPSMMMAQKVLEPLLGAHPLVLEPEQMNAIDSNDWSFAEAIEYAKMAHLPFEPIYLDFGGHQPVMVDLEAGPCRLYGAVIWRSGFFKTPTLAIAPIGGHRYLTGPFLEHLLAQGADEEEVRRYIGTPPQEVHPGDTYVSGLRGLPHIGTITRQQLDQWQYQTAGICWMGIETSDVSPYATLSQKVRLERKIAEVPMVFSTGEAVARAVGESALLEKPRHTQAQILTGLHDDVEADPATPTWTMMARMATEMVAKLTARALLGLYFIENAPVAVEPVPLSRPERREMDRERKKGRTPTEIASIVLIQGRRSEGGSGNGGSREHDYRWERRGYFMHIHENNRHYQNRPDLVKPCHKCSLEYAANERARRRGQELPHPFCESPDCIKKWVEPTVCGPEDKPLRKKVRVRRQDRRVA